ncbi:MAG: glycosyltransferase family 1 protein [Desulfarculaceae bacterium]|nr:glycosyltransferase family 1 protein [Desulfarculaceae bacterium]MCF8118282.1 glycosyltransferase family 1 protein [Desulfarculaceae bacterium]
MTEPRIVLITNMIAPYRIPLFNQVARLNPAFHVIFLRERDSDRKWRIPSHETRFSYSIMNSKNGRSGELSGILRCNLGIISALRRARPQVVILGGWADPENWLALAWCKAKRVPTVLWGGPRHLPCNRTGAGFELIRRFFVRSCDAYITYHSLASSVLQKMGAPADKISIGKNVGDIEFYYKRSKEIRQLSLVASKQKAGPSFLYVGRLVSIKGVNKFLKALSNLPANLNYRATIVGAGPEEAALRAFCAKHKMDHVVFVPFQNREGLARYFAMANIFVLSSLREYGAIVLSEALACGLYTLASCNDGVAPDLIKQGENGEIFDPSDDTAFVRILKKAIIAVDRESGLREHISAEFINSQPLGTYSRAFVEAVRLAQSGGAPSTTLDNRYSSDSDSKHAYSG